MVAHCSECVSTGVCVCTLAGLNAEHEFRVWNSQSMGHVTFTASYALYHHDNFHKISFLVMGRYGIGDSSASRVLSS